MNLPNSQRVEGATKILNGLFKPPATSTATLPPDETSEKNNLQKKPSSHPCPSSPPPPQEPKPPLPLPPTHLTPPPAPLTLTLTSLHPMHHPHCTTILHATPSDPNKQLQKFSQTLHKIFTESGYMLPAPDHRELLLHATIVNTIYVRSETRATHTRPHVTQPPIPQPPTKRNHRPNHCHYQKRPLTIDAREIIERYRHYVWMKDVRVEKIAICRMGAKKLENGEEKYEVEAEVDVPLWWG